MNADNLNKTVILTGVSRRGRKVNTPLINFLSERLGVSCDTAWFIVQNAKPGPMAVILACHDGENVADLFSRLRDLGAVVCLPTINFDNFGTC